MTTSDKYSNILAIDSSGSTLRVGVSCGDVFSECINVDRFRHAEFVFNLIEKALKESGLRKTDLDGLVVSTGPGSFTGLRVGLAAAKGLALALSLPLVGIPAYSAIAGPLFAAWGRALILIPSGRGEYYVYEASDGAFDVNSIAVRKSEEIAALSETIPAFLTDPDIKDSRLKNINQIAPDGFVISTMLYITAARKRLIECGGDDIDRLVPLYVQTFPVKARK